MSKLCRRSFFAAAVALPLVGARLAQEVSADAARPVNATASVSFDDVPYLVSQIPAAAESEDWGEITHYAIYDAETGESTGLLPLEEPRCWAAPEVEVDCQLARRIEASWARFYESL